MLRRNLIKILTSGCAALALCSCIKEDLGGGTVHDDKVRLTLYTNSAGYTSPSTRASEDGIDPPMVLVFKGQGATATFEEAVQAVTAAGVTTVTLSKSNAASTILLIANAPDSKFRSGTTELLFDEDNVSAAMDGKTLADVETQLRTIYLDKPQPSAPFSGSVNLPASGIKEVVKIDEDTKLGETNDKFKLERAVAKAYVTLDAGLTGYTVQGLGAAMAPLNGSLYRQSASVAVVGSGNTTKYLNGGEVIPIATASPLYLYEADKDLGTAIILKLSDRYYKLGFRHQDALIPVERNKEYNFIVKSVGNGYGTAEDAIDGTESNLIEYEIEVNDDTAHEMVSNGLYYLGLSNSEVASHDGNEGTVTLTNAFTITTDAWKYGIQKGTISYPSGVTGPASFLTGAAREITINVDELTNPYDPVTITVTVGNLALDVNVTRHFRINYAGRASLNNYLSAEVVSRGESNWLQGISGGGNYYKLEPLTLPAPGDLHILGFDNSDAHYRGAELYGLRQKDDGTRVRVKLFLEQDEKPYQPPIVKGGLFYVGAFWRNNQTGERLIRIRTSGALMWGEWRASVVEGEDWIVLDKRTSQDPNIWGQGTGEPADMNLEANDARYQVPGELLEVSGELKNEGLDSIYFRVGLKGTLADGEPPRYGVIMLEYTYDGELTYTNIYVRQGHEPDYLMGPNDETGPDGWQSTTRPAAVRFSPYNLTAEEFWEKDSQLESVQLDPRTPTDGGGKFTKYPSQAGAFFQWAQPATATEYIRLAYSPYLTTISPFNSTNINATAFSNQFWTGTSNLVETNETCPPGYRRPSSGPTHQAYTLSSTLLAGDIENNEIILSLFYNPLAVVNGTVYTSDLSNSLWGMYADGHFDRHYSKLIGIGNISGLRPVASVCTGDNRAAYVGRLYFNPDNNASLFLPAPGYRLGGSGGLTGIIVSDATTTTHGKYWSATANVRTTTGAKQAWSLQISAPDPGSFLTINHTSYQAPASAGLSIRCIVDE